MFFTISKIFGILLDPAFQIGFGLFVVLVLWRRRGLALTLNALLLLYVGALIVSPLPALLAEKLEKRYPAVLKPEHKPAAVVLSGGTIEYNERINQFQWEVSSDRIMEAVRLYRAHVVDLIVICGGTPRETPGLLDETPSMKKIALEEGIPEDRILLEKSSLNTRENAAFVKGVLLEKKIEDFYLVTSALHMRRAAAVFTKAGLHPTPFPVDFQVVGDGWQRYLVMGTAALELYKACLHEIVGYWIYKLVGFA